MADIEKELEELKRRVAEQPSAEIVDERDDDFQWRLPRSESMEGTDLTILGTNGAEVTVTDGERAAVYVPYQSEPLDGDISIVEGYVEAGRYVEANCVHLSNGRRSAVYVPSRLA